MKIIELGRRVGHNRSGSFSEPESCTKVHNNDYDFIRAGLQVSKNSRAHINLTKARQWRQQQSLFNSDPNTEPFETLAPFTSSHLLQLLIPMPKTKTLHRHRHHHHHHRNHKLRFLPISATSRPVSRSKLQLLHRNNDSLPSHFLPPTPKPQPRRSLHSRKSVRTSQSSAAAPPCRLPRTSRRFLLRCPSTSRFRSFTSEI